jgi:hypothetical protein
MCAAAPNASALVMSTTQHNSSPLPEGTRTSGGEPPTPPPREDDGTPSRKPTHLSLYCALAGGVLFVVAVLSGGAGRFVLPAGIGAFVLFIVAVYRNMPGADRQMSSDHAPGVPDDAPHRSDAARGEAEGEHHSADADFFRDFLQRRPQR